MKKAKLNELKSYIEELKIIKKELVIWWLKDI